MINHTEESNYYVYNRIDGTNDISKVDDIRYFGTRAFTCAESSPLCLKMQRMNKYHILY